MLRKIGSNFQITIPKEVVKNLNLHKNDYLDVEIIKGGIYLKPHVSIPKDQLYFHTPEWQKDEQEADEDIKAGRVTKTKNFEELMDILKGRKPSPFDED